MREIKVRNYDYGGCFTSFYVCKNCGKVLFREEFSWEQQHISMGDKDEIAEYMDKKAAKNDINFCFKCGVAVKPESEEL